MEQLKWKVKREAKRCLWFIYNRIRVGGLVAVNKPMIFIIGFFAIRAGIPLYITSELFVWAHISYRECERRELR